MAPTLPTSLPSSFVAGMSWQWTESPADFPPGDGWALTRRFVGASGVLSITAVATTVFTFSATPTETATLPAGEYRVSGYATLGAEKYPLDVVTVQVVADPATLAAGAQRTFNQRMLDALRARLEGRANADVESYSIGGRSISKMPFGELAKWEAIYAAKVRTEQGGTFGRTILAAFSPPSWP
jgi:hypothetical protein